MNSKTLGRERKRWLFRVHLALKLVLISSSRRKQEECKRAIETHVKESTMTRKLLHHDVLRKWTQPAINNFYRYCFDRRVMVEMDTIINQIQLSGSKESVSEAENEYNREQVRQREQAHLAIIARDIIWAYQVDRKHWEKYSGELNAHIEDAFASRLAKVSTNVFWILRVFN